MPEHAQSKRVPLSDAYARLGAELCRVRKTAGKKTREIQKPEGGFYGSGSISNVEGGYSAPSHELIKAYARLGGRYADLMTLLDRAKKSPHSEPTKDDEFDRLLLDPRTDPNLLRRGYAIDLEEDFSYISSDRVPTRNIYRVALRPLSPKAQFFVLRYGYEPDPRRGVATIQPGTGCELAFVDEADDGVIFAVLKYRQDDRDELGRCNFSWNISIDSDQPNDPYDHIHSRLLMAHVIKRIQFVPPALPEKIWWFRGVDPFQARIEPTPEQLLDLNGTNFYFHEFYNVEAEAVGLSWCWTP